MEDYEALTPEEIERERQRRRRRQAAREARRKKRIREAIIRCSILLILVILILIGIIKMISGVVHHFKDKKAENQVEQVIDASTEEATTEEIKAEIDPGILAKEIPEDRDAALAMLEELGKSDSDIQSIFENSAVYPDKILQCLAVNPEMKQYVLNYPAKISVVFDGDFSLDVPQNEVPLYLQYDERWGYADYGSSLIAINGSGPTCLSMAYTYLKQDGSMNPIKVADFSMENGYLGENNDTFWTLMTDGAASLGLSSEELSLNKESMTSALEDGKVIICSMDPGDFTKSSHFILIRSYENGLFYVNDSNSEARSNVGWDYERLSTQISNMWAISNSTSSTQSGEGDDSSQPEEISSDGTAGAQDGANEESQNDANVDSQDSNADTSQSDSNATE